MAYWQNGKLYLHGSTQSTQKIGLAKNGRVTAIDAFIVSDAGPYEKGGDAGSAANSAAINYTPLSMRFRGTYVLTNTPPRSSQRAPGGLQGINMFEPLIAKGAR